MRIISKFHDYYDTAMTFGIDTECVYVRDTLELKHDNNLRCYMEGYYKVEEMVLLFCGKVYKIIKYEDKLYYNKEDLPEKIKRSYTKLNSYFCRSFYNDSYDSYKELHFKHKCPLILMKKDKIIINPNLKELEFYRHVPSAEAFQEIYMYISGVIGKKEVDNVSISDYDKLRQHGFDSWSFKKHKDDNNGRSKKKTRRNKR